MSEPEETFDRRRAWTILVLGLTGQTASSVFLSTPAFLIPLLHTDRGLSLSQAGLLAAAPNLGTVLSLVAWGALTDHYGERRAIVSGLTLTALAAIAVMSVHGYVAIGTCLLLGGMAAASTSAASGKLVMGWFPTNRRGLAMGIRQMAQPLGVTIAAVTVPTLAHHGIPTAMSIALGANALLAIACWIWVRNPEHTAHTATVAVTNPYRESRFLARIHAVSALLVVPQYTVATFGLVWLVTQLHYSELIAGALVAVAQLLGATGRIGVGVLSDRVRSRVKPLRWVACSAIAVMVLMALGDEWGSRLAAAALVIAAIVTVADNGLAFTAVAEAAGRSWSGRAIGVQNTGQFIVAAAVGPVVGALIGAAGYTWAYALVALCPAIAYPLIPTADMQRDAR
jgi:MFS family permease